MFSGLKFIPRDKIDEAVEEDLDVSNKKKKKSNSRREKRRKKSTKYGSSEDEDLDKIKKGKRKKWYSSDESSSSDSGEQKHRRTKCHTRREYSDDESQAFYSIDAKDTERKDMGLEWMLRPKDSEAKKSTVDKGSQPQETQVEEVKQPNPRELNPYFKDNGSGYPEEEHATNTSTSQLSSSSGVGDGGASWRLKALKRAQEQAAREGRQVEEVVGERWGSLSRLAVSEASRVAPSRAHLHAIKNRQRGKNEEFQTVADRQTEQGTEKHVRRDYLKDVTVRHPEMKAPRVHDSLSWGKSRNHETTTKKEYSQSAAMPSNLNKLENKESIVCKSTNERISDLSSSLGSHANCCEDVRSEPDLSECRNTVESSAVVKQAMSANQLAAKALQLRMKGKLQEAEELLKEAENIKAKDGPEDEQVRPHSGGGINRYLMQNKSAQRRKEEDADMNLAQKIVQNKKFSISGQADDEYDYDDGPRRKSRKKGGGNDNKAMENTNFARRIMTQQERCLFCFENPNRPKHLVVSIANFTYLMLPQSQPVVPGHCLILPMQHEASTRTADNNVWDELRNFKKCLIMMFAEQEKDVVFLETVMGLAQQKRHCLIECIPLPRDIARQAPLYYKKAIDEAEDEWSQHNAKKLIDTSEKGLRGSIPKDFPYFHVEFGLNKGFVHVIDDEKEFKSNLGLNVIRGMLELADEDMYRRRRHETVDAQRKAVASFVQDWTKFDWTKQLD